MEEDKQIPTTVYADGRNDACEPVPVPVKLSIGQKIRNYVWDADMHLQSPEERRLVRKLDFGILTCTTLGYWIKYIDQSNVSNAYVSGMREDLHMFGNEYNYMLTCYTIAYAVMQIPANVIALKFRPRLCIIICEVGWTIFTFAQAGARSSSQMYAFRFMVGLFESAFAPVVIFLIGTWYTKAELAKRISIWHLTSAFGLATSGFLQAGIHKSLDGRLGLPGWRWLYIICGCISVPVALSVWWLLPDYPHNTRIWYLTDEDKQVAMQRAAKQHKSEVTGVINFKLIKRMLGSWRWWILCSTYIFYGLSTQAYNYFAIYLKYEGYSVAMSNTIPAVANIATMVTEFLYGFLSDATGSRTWLMIGPIMCTTVVGSSMLTAWPSSDSARIVAFFLLYCGFVTGIVFSWANEINTGNAEERALTISCMSGLFYAINAGLPIVLFPQTMAPTFPRGFPSMIAFALIAVVLILIGSFFHKRQLSLEAEQRANQPPSELTERKVHGVREAEL